jgi:putative transposase
MKKGLFSNGQRKAILLESSQTNTSVEKVCEKHHISPATYYKWQKADTIEQNVDKKRVSELEKENAKFKKMYLEAQLEKEVLTEAVSILKKFAALNKKISWGLV